MALFQDQDGISYPNGLGWSSSLAYGAELRVAGIGDPTRVDFIGGTIGIGIFWGLSMWVMLNREY